MPNIFLKPRLGGITDHSGLDELDYVSSGHMGFASSDNLTTVSGNLSTHIADADKHREINDSATGPTDLWSAQKIESEIATISGAVDDHNELKNIQGGAPDDYYHLTSAQHTDLTDGGDCSIHKHDDRYYTETEVDNLHTTLSGNLQTNIDGKDNYSSWSFAVDGVTKDAITSGDVLDFVGGDNITITRSADDQITISGSAGEIDHGALTGLSDDDHPALVPRDGSRGFTATVSGIDPTEDYHLTTKSYVDDETAMGDAYLHTQTTASGEWNITHGLNYKYLSVTVFDDADKVIQPSEIEAISANELKITFSSPESGHSVLTYGIGDQGGSYTHTQVSGSASWSVNHGLEANYPVVECYEATGEAVEPSTITTVDQNNLTITFGTTVSGFATVIAGGIAGATEKYLLRDGTRTLTSDWSVGEHSIELTEEISNNYFSSGNIATMQVDSNSIGFGCALFMASGGNFEEASATSTATMPCTVLALAPGTGQKKVLLQGFTRNNDWDWMPGENLFVSTTSGTLTQTTASGSGEQIQVVGFATHADRIYFNPNIMLIEIY